MSLTHLNFLQGECLGLPSPPTCIANNVSNTMRQTKWQLSYKNDLSCGNRDGKDVAEAHNIHM